MRKNVVIAVVMLLALALGTGAARADEALQVQAPDTCQEQAAAAVPENGAAPLDLLGVPAPEAKIRCAPPSCSSDLDCIYSGQGYKCYSPSIFVCPYCV